MPRAHAGRPKLGTLSSAIGQHPGLSRFPSPTFIRSPMATKLCCRDIWRPRTNRANIGKRRMRYFVAVASGRGRRGRFDTYADWHKVQETGDYRSPGAILFRSAGRRAWAIRLINSLEKCAKPIAWAERQRCTNDPVINLLAGIIKQAGAITPILSDMKCRAATHRALGAKED
jgi:hypothetical protein